MADDAVRIDNTVAWLRKAEQDLRRIGRCLEDDPPDREDALFHSQQAVEKALKACLTCHDVPFRKTHDLAALGAQCSEVDPALGSALAQVDELTPYAWSYRYPTELIEPPEADALEAKVLATQIVEAVISRLPAEVQAQSRGPANKPANTCHKNQRETASKASHQDETSG
jgi:HEPN domain-containing protein